MQISGINFGTAGFRVRAPLRVANAPTIGNAFMVSNTTANVTYTVPGFTGDTPIESYTAIAFPGGATGILNTSGSGTITVTGLTDNTNYTFSVTANNTDGPSTNSTSTNSILTNSFPSAPTISYVELTSFSTANIVYTAPAYNGNSVITGYTAVSNVGGITATVSTANSGNITVTGLISNTSYSFSVYAINQYGRGPSSNLSNGIFTVGTPGAPTLQYVRVLSGTTAEIVYTANNYIGNSNIVSYTATSNPGGITATVNTANSGNIIVDGLTIGTDYSFDVTATNLAGTSLSSNSSFTVTYPIDTYPPVEYLVVAGGGGGPAGVPGTGTHGGGGAGGFIGGNTLATYQVVAAANTLLVLVGSGGAGLGIAPGNPNNFGSPTAFRIGNSGNKSVLGNTLSNVLITATGGGGGTGGYDVGATPGGSGGGSYYDPGENGIIGQGYPGAPGNYKGGGGGASQSGQGAYGGNGISSSITGTANYYAGGGAGGAYWAGGPMPPATSTYFGGLGGGGNSNVNVGLSGSINTGGGGAAGWGGGQYAPYTAGGGGGSGIVVVRYPTAFTAANTANGSPNVNVTGGYRIYTYTSSGAISIPSTLSYTNVLYPTVRTLTIPNAPTITSWTIGSTTATIGYSAPSYNGNSNITSYTLVSVPENKTATVSTASSGSISMTGLTPNTTYVFSVYATNSVGSSVPSIPTPYLTTPALGGADIYFKNTTLLLSGDGTNNATNNTFLDSSTNNAIITRNGNSNQGTFSPYGSNWSNYFDGTGDYLTVPDNTALQFSTGAFTMELWFYPTATISSQILLAKGTGSDGFELRSRSSAGGNYFSFWAANGATAIVESSVTLTLNTWQHLAVVRSGGTMTLYKNGVNVGSASDSTSFVASGSALRVGVDVSAGTLYSTGYISNVRIVKGTAVYTAAFTPSTIPLTAISGTSLLTCQNNRFIDSSTNTFTITRNGDVSVQKFGPFSPSEAYSASTMGGSAYFDGTGDYLSLPSTALVTTTTNFTFEAWVYPTSTADATMFYIMGNTGSYAGVRIGIINNLAYILHSTNGASWLVNLSSASGTVPLNTWTHIAVTRNVNAGVMWINGVSAITFTFGTLMTGTTNYIGAYNSGGAGGFFTGYMSGARIVDGTAVYTSAFTPPTTPLTAISGTSLLTNFTNAGIYDATMLNNLEAFGDVKLSTTVSKFGGSSIRFDGTGDYLLSPSTQFSNISFGTGDFTIECWLYQVVFSADMVIAASFTTWASSVNFYLGTRAGSPNILIFRAGDTAPIALNGNTGLTTNTWTHIAVSRASGVTRMFVGGVLQTATHTGSVNASATVKAMGIGADNFGTEPINGYIDDLRITKGVARYTTTFTPPAALEIQ